jgi:hypothetical protein
MQWMGMLNGKRSCDFTQACGPHKLAVIIRDILSQHICNDCNVATNLTLLCVL